MEIKQAREEKKQLESQIEKLLKEFFYKTGLEIESIDFGKEEFAGPSYWVRIRIIL